MATIVTESKHTITPIESEQDKGTGEGSSVTGNKPPMPQKPPAVGNPQDGQQPAIETPVNPQDGQDRLSWEKRAENKAKTSSVPAR